MAKVYSIDQMLKNARPVVELRGRYFEVRDLSVADRLRKLVELRDHQAALEEKLAKAVEDGHPVEDETRFDQLREVVEEGVREALIDVPENILSTITEREWHALAKIINVVREQSFPLVVEDRELDPNPLGQPKPEDPA